MKHNTKLTPEQKVVQAAIKWYRSCKGKFNEPAFDDFVKVIVRFRKTQMERARLERYDPEQINYHALSENEKGILDCTWAWWDVSISERAGSTDEYLNGLQEVISIEIEHQKQVKRDAIVEYFVYDSKRSNPSELVRWCGRMARKGARYFGNCWTGYDWDEFVVASKLPITSRDVKRECKRNWEEI